MATTQTLKKKLNGVKSIQKVSKALKTASTVKLSQLNTAYGNYKTYAGHCQRLYADNRELFELAFKKRNAQAPVCLVLMASNKGMCGSFNTDLLHFATEQINAEGECRVVLVGQWLRNWFDENNLSYERAFVFGDIPTYEDSVQLYAYIKSLIEDEKSSGVELIYPQYRNMMSQSPARCTLFGGAQTVEEGIQPLFYPDLESVIRGMAENVMIAALHERVLENALGAQAATLMTMRSAYDTASEYSQQLEGEINQKRQSRVTSDVIETSAEFSREEDEL